TFVGAELSIVLPLNEDHFASLRVGRFQEVHIDAEGYRLASFLELTVSNLGENVLVFTKLPFDSFSFHEDAAVILEFAADSFEPLLGHLERGIQGMMIRGGEFSDRFGRGSRNSIDRFTPRTGGFFRPSQARGCQTHSHKQS